MNKINNSFLQKRIFRKVPIISLIGLFTGVMGGYLYYYYIGCNSGGCPITSRPDMSMLWGAIIGYLLFDLFAPPKKS